MTRTEIAVKPDRSAADVVTPPTTKNEYAAAPGFRHFPQLDGFRGLCILLVLLGHSAEYSPEWPPQLLGFRATAELGVTCFFILSGFLITCLLIDEQKRTGNISLSRFYWKRALRIVPAYYVMLAVTALLTSARLVTDVAWHTFIACFCYVSDLIGRGLTVKHTWSLSLEEQFYLIWPISLKSLSARHRFACVLTLFLGLQIWRGLAIWTGLFQPHLTFRPDFRFDAILAGCLVGLCWIEKRNLRAIAILGLPAAAVFAAAVAWSVCFAQLPLVRPVYLTVQVWLSTWLLCLLVVNGQTGFASVLSRGTFAWLGKISYSLYLWQQMFLATKEPSWGMLRCFPVNMVCVFLAAIISYKLIETPMLSLRKKLPPAVCP
jgi:peptidoglycan/LPS O-acetylase OafA/YrhL